MSTKLWPALLAAAATPVVAGCGVDQLTQDRLLIWHDWPEPEAAVLVDLLDGYADVAPDLDLIVEYVPDDEIEERLASEAASGFGPDVLIGVDASRLVGLVDRGAVHAISDAQLARHGFDELDPKAMSAMLVDDAQAGIPLAAFTDVLYYRDGVTPPETLDDIIELAEDGLRTAIPLDFLNAYWGVDAFDGTVFGADGQVAPDDGFVAWLDWLVAARPHPNVILEGEYEVLRDLFAQGRIDLFVGGSRELGTFRSQLRDDGPDADGPDGADTDGEAAADTGDDADPDDAPVTLADIADVTFGLAVLPSGENPAPGGFMEVEGMVVNRHTANLGDALSLLDYLTNVPSQGRIARSGVGRIPVNDAVAIDPTTSPMEAALVAQQRRALVLPRDFEARRRALTAAADEVVAQVTRGVIEPEHAPEALLAGVEQQTTEAIDG